eukprot:c32008_g1_i1 orf=78-254(+)
MGCTILTSSGVDSHFMWVTDYPAYPFMYFYQKCMLYSCIVVSHSCSLLRTEVDMENMA